MADRFRREHRSLERIRRADVGLRCAGPHGNAVADASIFDNAPSDDLSLFDVVIELAKAKRGQVPGRAGGDLLVQRRSNLETDVDLVSSRFLESGRKLTHPRRRGLIEEDGDLGCVGGACMPRPERGDEAEHH
jgi:hypothetical protein